MVVAPQFYDAVPFSEGPVLVTLEGEGGDELVGYIDRTGAFAIASQFRYGEPFRRGLAQVSLGAG